MPDIGAMLRETRMRQRIDITDVESATKIRAKYLRALENEEWDLLPGPTFVKTFLRTYAEYLGLDSKLLVEEYKQRYERPGPGELLPFAGSRAARRGPPRRSLPPLAIVGIVVAGLLALLFWLGSIGDETEEPLAPSVTATPTAERTATASRPRRRRTATAPRRLRLQIVAEALVNVCLLDASGKRLIDSEDLSPGQNSRTFRGRRFKVAFGNGAVRMRLNGRTVAVPDRPDPIGFEIVAGRRPRELSASARPVCS